MICWKGMSQWGVARHEAGARLFGGTFSLFICLLFYFPSFLLPCHLSCWSKLLAVGEKLVAFFVEQGFFFLLSLFNKNESGIC